MMYFEMCIIHDHQLKQVNVDLFSLSVKSIKRYYCTKCGL